MRRLLIVFSVALAAGWLRGTAGAQETASLSTADAKPLEGSVRLGEMAALVPAQGSVAARDRYRLKSTIEGRAEAVLASTGVWVQANAPMGFLIDQDLAAIIDQTTTPVDITEERWQRMYQPTPIRFPHECFVLRKFIQNKKQVRLNAFLFEVARSLALIGTVAAKDCHWLRQGVLVRAWPKGQPSQAIEARVDRWEESSDAQASCAVEAGLSQEAFLPANTLWEGRIEIPVIKKALSVPTAALLHYRGAAYLPVRVSTGGTVGDDTEILSGVEANRGILILHPAPKTVSVPARALGRSRVLQKTGSQKVRDIAATQTHALPLSVQEPQAPDAQANTPEENPAAEATPNEPQGDVEPNPRDLPPGDNP